MYTHASNGIGKVRHMEREQATERRTNYIQIENLSIYEQKLAH